MKIKAWVGTEAIESRRSVAEKAGRSLTRTGAVVEFSGVVRDLENGNPIEALFYEAHEAMALKQLRSIAEELGEAFAVQRVETCHRLGWVEVGQTSFFLRVESVHRAEALSFCADYIDRLKQDVPIWKSDQR